MLVAVLVAGCGGIGDADRASGSADSRQHGLGVTGETAHAAGAGTTNAANAAHAARGEHGVSGPSRAAGSGDAAPPGSSDAAHATPSAAPGTDADPDTRPHTRIDGRAFPEKVIALTWDDGPDANTLELAEYLAERRIAATFFVVGSWIPGLSDDPGDGKDVLGTGYHHIPILGDLVALGHRLGNHTLNHVVLREDAGLATIDRQLRDNQRSLDPFLSNELRLFRAPGGGWGSAAASVVDGDPYLAKMIGPIAWDIDRKDWDESLHCRGPRSSFECERAGPGGALRMKPSVVAARYVATIDSIGHGIVLLHDRVGHVGSTYGLDVAQAMVPQLEARGYVFAAPVLRFSPPLVRDVEHLGEWSSETKWESGTLRVADVNGDGRADVCGRTASGVRCAIAVTRTGAGDGNGHLPRTIFRAPHPGTRPTTAPPGALHLADITGDGQADVCVATPTEIACAASNVVGELGPFRAWGAASATKDSSAAALRLGDVDGDGRADACTRTPEGIACAKNAGRRFEAPRAWLSDANAAKAWNGDAYASTVQLADVDGDGRADVCGRTARGIACATSTGRGFGRLDRWSQGSDFADASPAAANANANGPGAATAAAAATATATAYAAVRFGDLNGDGRADVCAVGKDGVACAFSTGKGFTRAMPWLAGDVADAQGWRSAEFAGSLQLADVNGDRRADLCGRGFAGVVCALAP